MNRKRTHPRVKTEADLVTACHKRGLRLEIWGKPPRVYRVLRGNELLFSDPSLYETTIRVLQKPLIHPRKRDVRN